MEGRALLTAASLAPPILVPAALTARVTPLSGDNDTPPSGAFEGADLNYERFSLKGSTTKYDVKFTSGDYRFTQNYKMTIRRIRGAEPTEFAATDAVGVFADTLAVHIERLLGVGMEPTERANPAQVPGEDFVIQSARFRNNGGKTTYDLTIAAGEYRFKQSYTLKLNRINNDQPGATAVEGAEAFYAGLTFQIENALGIQPMPAQARRRA